MRFCAIILPKLKRPNLDPIFSILETALLKVTNDIPLSMNRQHLSLLVLLDLSSAFDTVYHTILLNRLQSHFGICDSSLSWFESYFSGRTQFVSINVSNSSNVPAQHGVHQGSCLSPLLFCLYTSSLFDLIKSHLPDMHCYAEDLRSIFLLNPIPSLLKILRSLPSNIASLPFVLGSSPLLINDTKTEFLILRIRQQLSMV